MGIVVGIVIGGLHQYMLVLCLLEVAAVGSPHEPACEMGSSHLPAYLLKYYPGSVAKMDGLLVW